MAIDLGLSMMTMSPKTKQSVLNISAAIGAFVALSGLMAPIARALDGRYVHAEVYAQDSINAFYRQQYIAAKLAKIDTLKANTDTLKAKLDTLLSRQRGPRR